jgi:hypothetical protein
MILAVASESASPYTVEGIQMDITATDTINVFMKSDIIFFFEDGKFL